MSDRDIQRCDIRIEPGRIIRMLPEKTREVLSMKQTEDYLRHRREYVDWMLTEGKDPRARQGYSPYTVYATAGRCATYDRWTWDARAGYSVPPRPADASQYMEHVAYSDRSQATKAKIEEALTRYHRWLTGTYDVDEWESEYSFDASTADHVADYLTRRERRLVRDAALDISDSWRETSLIWTALDAALRPVEVARATTEWVDVPNQILRIPRDESSKNNDNWRVSITERTAESLQHWIDERSGIDKYSDTNTLWLTRRSNPYSAKSLARLTRRACDAAGIDAAGRSITMYSIRHSTGTYMVEERDLAAAQTQLRHQSAETTMRYDAAPVEDRRDALERM